MLMAEKSIKTRIQMKRATSEEWGKAAGFKPLEGEQIFYTDLNVVVVGRYKAGTTEAQKKSANHTDYLMLLSDLLAEQTNTLISHGTSDPSASTASQYYFKY
jgi:hypothetical protein